MQVFALWFFKNGNVEVAGIDLFFFGDDLKIKTVAAFREPVPPEKARFLQ
jgi:hypothetical protein